MVLEITAVGKSFPVADGPAVTALSDVTLSVAEGEFVSIIGPSGCGKSTLFNIVGGLITDFDGSVRVDGHEIRGPHREIGMVFQEESTFPWRSALRNVELPLEIAGVPRAERHERARDLLRLVGLEGFENRFPREMSGGMRQRVSIARTLAFEPRIMLMDEPFGALDEFTRNRLDDDLVRLWWERRLTTVFVTHSIYEAVFLSTRIIVMAANPGRIFRTMTIDAAQPRDVGFRDSPQFAAYCRELSAWLAEASLPQRTGGAA